VGGVGRKVKTDSPTRQLAYSDDPVLLRAFVTGEWPPDMEFMETWAAAHAIAARGYATAKSHNGQD
jgi:hypothetical protein